MSKRWIVFVGIGAALLAALLVLGSALPAAAKGHSSKGGLGLIKLYNQALLNAVVQVAGLTEKQVKDGLKSGQSLEEIVKSAGKGSIFDVEDAAKKTITDGINQLVTDGKLTSKHAATLLGNLDKRLSTAVRKHHRPSRRKGSKTTTTPKITKKSKSATSEPTPSVSAQ